MELKRGDIIHSRSICEIDHGKFFVILNICDETVAGFFFINSVVNKFIKDKQEQLELQYPIRPCDYHFLTHDSFICGSNLIEVSVALLYSQFEKGIAKKVGMLHQIDMDNLMNSCRKSKIYSIRTKKCYFYDKSLDNKHHK